MINSPLTSLLSVVMVMDSLIITMVRHAMISARAINAAVYAVVLGAMAIPLGVFATLIISRAWFA